jgi:hypothetical protein
MINKQTLPELLLASKGKKLIFLGRENIFTKEEIERFLKKYNITLCNTHEEDVVLSVENSSLNPVEEDISSLLYDANIPSFTLEVFEKLLSNEINDDELLMGIKLNNDQNRIFRLLGNSYISESLFIKLLMMYEWHHDDEDNREDRDVIMYTLKRYIEIKPNETDLLYSYLTLRRLATQADNPKLLLALIGFQNFEFLIRGKERVTLRETIAKNRHLDNELITKLISLREHRVDVALASNPSVTLSLLKSLLSKNSEDINQALATNKNIDNQIFETLLSKEETTIQLLLLSQPIDMERLTLINKKKLKTDIFATLGANEHLTKEVIEELMCLNDENLLSNLASNPTLPSSFLEQIYNKNIPLYFEHLAINPTSPLFILEGLYKKDNLKINIALAYNRSTPEYILRELFKKDIFEIYQSLASNASVPLELLDILKVDTRLQNELAKNEIFVKEYETTLDYDKKAVQF